MIENITKQDYKGPVHWVIVDGSTSEEDQDKMEEEINTNISSAVAIPVKYVSTKHVEKKAIGLLRNISNENIPSGTGFVVIMDDDDWYPAERISHAVHSLQKSRRELAGCSAMIMYDWDSDMLLQFKGFGPNHSTNNCFAYTVKYAKEHTYNEEASFAEESSFTDHFKQPMVQLDPYKTVVHISHGSNTVNKRELVLNLARKIEVVGRPLSQNPKKVIKSAPLWNVLDAVEQTEETIPDIVYYMGSHCIEWDPLHQENLGGSEQAVVKLSRHWAQLGKTVHVFGRFPFKGTQVDSYGVTWSHFCCFRFRLQYKIVVLWRGSGMLPVLSMKKLKANKVYVDVHDNLGYEDMKEYARDIDGIFLKSRFHEVCLNHILGEGPHGLPPIHIIPNGVRVEDFEQQPEGTVRNPYRFCYASCYTRGLEPLLKWTWPYLKRLVPEAELHVYYGMDQVQDAAFKERMYDLLQQDGVTDHGRQDMQTIIREKWTSSFHLYYTASLGEIDCISIRESLVCGCVPILSCHNVFQEREGFHFPGQFDQRSYLQLAQQICQLVSCPDYVAEARAKLRQSDTVNTWEDTAKKWLKVVFPT